jgi:hypothetical protein
MAAPLLHYPLSHPKKKAKQNKDKANKRIKIKARTQTNKQAKTKQKQKQTTNKENTLCRNSTIHVPININFVLILKLYKMLFIFIRCKDRHAGALRSRRYS